MPDEQKRTLKEALERLYAKYNHRSFIDSDPVQFVHRYRRREDMEIAGFVAAALAYGRVEQIKRSVGNLLERMGTSPAGFVRDFDKASGRKLQSFRHRFTGGEDMSDLFSLLKDVLNEDGSIEKFFGRFFNRNDENVIPALSKFCGSLYAMYTNKHRGRVSRGLKYLLANPAKGGACKRLNLFLRWMVRKDEVDVGLWSAVDKSKLIMPVDVHIGRLCRTLGFHSKKNVSLAGAVGITKCFAAIEPSDPVKYDFALSRVGILQDCKGKLNSKCPSAQRANFLGIVKIAADKGAKFGIRVGRIGV